MSQPKSANQKPRNLIIFLDCGDTIIDEGTEVRDAEGTVISGNVIPGADVMVKTLAERGFRLAIVADGTAQSFKNLLTLNGHYDYFGTLIYSETIKASKPSFHLHSFVVRQLRYSFKITSESVAEQSKDTKVGT